MKKLTKNLHKCCPDSFRTTASTKYILEAKKRNSAF